MASTAMLRPFARLGLAGPRKLSLYQIALPLCAALGRATGDHYEKRRPHGVRDVALPGFATPVRGDGPARGPLCFVPSLLMPFDGRGTLIWACRRAAVCLVAGGRSSYAACRFCPN